MSTRTMLQSPFRRAPVCSVALLVIALGTLWTSQPASAETWTDLSGTRSVEGKMVGLWGDTLILVLNDGRRVDVPMRALEAESRIQAEKVSEQLAERRAERVEELRAQADVAAAPAPDPLPQPAPAPPYEKPVADMPVAKTILHVREQLLAGHLIIAFDSMPPSYREDAQAVVRQAAAKFDPAAWQAVTGAVHTVGDLVITRQNWIFSHPRFEALNAETSETVEQFVLALAGIMRDGFDPETTRLEDLREMPLRDWLLARDEQIAPHVFAITERFAGQLPSPQIEVQNEQEDSVTVRTTQGETTETARLTKVEGFWVPTEEAQAWPKRIEEAKAKLESIPDGSLGAGVAQTLASTLQPALEPLRSAESAAEFHAAMDSLFQSAAPAIQMAAMFGGGMEFSSGSGNAGGGPSMQNYEMEMEDMNMEDYERQMQKQMEMQMEMQSPPQP